MSVYRDLENMGFFLFCFAVLVSCGMVFKKDGVEFGGVEVCQEA
jgi:hypothetical protein